MQTKFIKGNSNDLIIFLMGWGSDDKQFENMTSKNNLLYCWDYSDLNFEFDFSSYENIDLISFSAGVFIAGIIENKLPKLRYKIAINGNPKIFDKYFGIKSDALGAVQKLTLDNCMDFRRKYLVYDEKELIGFNKSCRTIESCEHEMKKLQEYYAQNQKEMSFDLVMISDSDKIFYPERQMEYYKKGYVILKNQAHNVFSKFRNFDEIIGYLK